MRWIFVYDDTHAVKAAIHSPILVIDVALALVALILELSRVRGSSFVGRKELNSFSNNFESSINSPDSISFTSFAGSSFTESVVTA